MPLITDALARLVSRFAPEAKASRTGPLIAYENLGAPVWNPRDYATFAREGFMQNAIVYRCVRMISEAAASIPICCYQGLTEHEDHPLLALIRSPSPHLTGRDFLESFLGYLLVSGNTYVEAVAIHGEVRELYALRPDRITIIPGDQGWPAGYTYTAAGGSVTFSGDVIPGVRPILHLKLFHPLDDHYGMSPIEAAATAIDIHNQASRWNKALLDNAARPSGALVYAAREGRLTPEQFERLKAELQEGFQGAKNAGRPLLLEGGLDWKPLSLSPKDMDFIEAKHTAAREIALALGVPPMLLGIPGDNTYTDDPADPGGPTNLGITLADYADFLVQPVNDQTQATLVAGLKQIPQATVRSIYEQSYWQPAGCAEMPPPFGFFHFDTAVNMGVGTAARMLQTALGCGVDGAVGPLTLAALSAADPAKTLATYADLRRRRYRSLATFPRFGRGWLSRVDTTLSRALALIPSPTSKTGPKAMTTTATTPATTTPTDTIATDVAKWWGNSSTIWGAVVTGLAAILPALGPAFGLTITSDSINTGAGQVSAIIQAVVGLAGTIATIRGRVTATQPLTFKMFSIKI